MVVAAALVGCGHPLLVLPCCRQAASLLLPLVNLVTWVGLLTVCTSLAAVPVWSSWELACAVGLAYSKLVPPTEMGGSLHFQVLESSASVTSMCQYHTQLS